jgi:hypothetical protein
MGFRIGRKHAAHTYPSSQGNSTLLFARNFAQGPAAPQEITASPVNVGWASIESGATPGTSVPITPKQTGLLLITGVVEMENGGEVPVNVQIQVAVGGITVATPATEVTVGAGAFATVPVQALVGQAVGATYDISLVVTVSVLSALTLNTNDSTLSVREVPAATG